MSAKKKYTAKNKVKYRTANGQWKNVSPQKKQRSSISQSISSIWDDDFLSQLPGSTFQSESELLRSQHEAIDVRSTPNINGMSNKNSRQTQKRRVSMELTAGKKLSTCTGQMGTEDYNQQELLQYVNVLKEGRFFCTFECGDGYARFVLLKEYNEFNPSKRSCIFVFVTASSVTLESTKCNVFHCHTCHDISSSSALMCNDLKAYSAYLAQHPTVTCNSCMHIATINHLYSVKEIDVIMGRFAVNPTLPKTNAVVVQLEWTHSISWEFYAVRPVSDPLRWGVLTRKTVPTPLGRYNVICHNNIPIKCHDKCAHVRGFKAERADIAIVVPERDEEEDVLIRNMMDKYFLDGDLQTETLVPPCISRRSIPDGILDDVNNDSLSRLNQEWNETFYGGGTIRFSSTGSSALISATLYAQSHIHDVLLERGYDGADQCFINVNDNVLVAYPLILECLEQLHAGHGNYTAYWGSYLARTKRLQRSLDINKHLYARKHFQEACISHMILVKPDYSILTCPDCKGEGGVNMDGTPINMKASKCGLRSEPIPADALTINCPDFDVLHFLPSTMSMSTKETEIRKLLQKFSARDALYAPKKRKLCGAPKCLTQSEYDTVLRFYGSSDCARSELTQLRVLLADPVIETERNGCKYSAHTAYGSFLYALLSNYPTCSVLHINDVSRLENVLQSVHVDVELILQLRSCSPLIATVLHHDTSSFTFPVSAGVKCLLRKLVTHVRRLDAYATSMSTSISLLATEKDQFRFTLVTCTQLGNACSSGSFVYIGICHVILATPF